MKKKLRMISKLFGAFSLIGCFGFGLFLLLEQRQKQNAEVSAYSSISELELQNGNGSINSYLIEGKVINSHLVNPSDSEAVIYGLDYGIKIYYTGVGSYQEMDFLTTIVSITYKDSNSVSHILNNINRINNSYHIDLGANDGTFQYKMFSLNFGRLTYDTLNSLYNIEGVLHLWTNTLMQGNPKFTYQFSLPFSTSIYNPPSSINYAIINDTEINGYYDNLLSLKDTLVDSYNTAYQNALDSNSQGIYETGYQDGYNTGYSEANTVANEMLQDSYQNGYESGYQYGEANATSFYESAMETVHNNGYNQGYGQGLSDGEAVSETQLSDKYWEGYQYGYDEGYTDGYSSDSVVTSIFSGILQVALVPINFFLAIFNFEILGINLSGFIKALFTVAITVIIIKTIFGGKGASE